MRVAKVTKQQKYRHAKDYHKDCCEDENEGAELQQVKHGNDYTAEKQRGNQVENTNGCTTIAASAATTTERMDLASALSDALLIRGCWHFLSPAFAPARC